MIKNNMGTDLFRPKGPFPFHISDLERDTLCWAPADRWHYLKLLCWLWSQGGFIADNDKDIAGAAGIDLRRNWRGRVAILRTKLRPIEAAPTEEKAVSNALVKLFIRESFPLLDQEKPRFLYQKRVIKDLAKAAELSRKRAAAGEKGGRRKQANATGDVKQLSSTPTPTLVSKKEEEDRESNDSKLCDENSSQKGNGATPPVAPPKYKFEGQIIRLNAKNFDDWQRDYHTVDLPSKLRALDAWCVGKAISKKDWYWIVSTSIEKEHKANLLAKQEEKAQNSMTKGQIARNTPW